MTYGQMDNKQLQGMAFDYVLRLREFHRRYKAVDSQASEDAFNARRSPSTEVERSALWQRETEERSRRSDETKQRFNSEFRADCSLLYAELLKRSGAKKEDLVALDYGMLSGPSPVEEVAFELERLAKMLETPAKVLPFRVQ
ncbi:MAG: hypothetical protein JWN34_2007 [Bryobacterales bacterium]|nr:hypothetical protein [Bryobacterales bacterium]